jgi:hypothetical protein
MLDAIEHHRTAVIAVGRQSGKSSIAAVAAVWDATCRPELDLMMTSGRTRYALVACPGEAQAREVIELCESAIEASPVLRPLATVKADRIDFRLERERADGTRFEARTAIRALPANSRTIRGMSASLIVLDELAHFSDSAGPASDERMWAALLPATRVFASAAHVVACSTPAGLSGKFWELFQAASGSSLQSAVAIRMATAAVVPNLDLTWLEGQRLELGEALYEQEYCAEFVSGAGAFFDLSGIEFEPGPAPPEAASSWVAGLDPAFHQDRFGVALVGRDNDGALVVGRVEAIEPGRRLGSLDARRGREDRTLARAWEIIEPYRARIVTDQHQADGISSYFGRLGRSVTVRNLTSPLQTEAFVSMRARLMDGSLRLWEHPSLIEDLRRVRARDSESIVLPRYAGGHCDAASALALAVYEQRHSGIARVYVPQGYLPRFIGSRPNVWSPVGTSAGQRSAWPRPSIWQLEAAARHRQRPASKPTDQSAARSSDDG